MDLIVATNDPRILTLLLGDPGKLSPATLDLMNSLMQPVMLPNMLLPPKYPGTWEWLAQRYKPDEASPNSQGQAEEVDTTTIDRQRRNCELHMLRDGIRIAINQNDTAALKRRRESAPEKFDGVAASDNGSLFLKAITQSTLPMVQFFVEKCGILTAPDVAKSDIFETIERTAEYQGWLKNPHLPEIREYLEERYAEIEAAQNAAPTVSEAVDRKSLTRTQKHNLDMELLNAVLEGDAAKITRLIEAGASANARYANRQTAFGAALELEDGSKEIARAIIEASKAFQRTLFVNARNAYGQTLLAQADTRYDTEAAVLLLRHGAKTNRQFLPPAVKHGIIKAVKETAALYSVKALASQGNEKEQYLAIAKEYSDAVANLHLPLSEK